MTETSDSDETPASSIESGAGLKGGPRRACLGLLVAALVGLGLGRLAGVWIAFDIFNHFVWHLLILAIAALIGLALSRWHLRTALALALVGYLGISLWALTWGRDAGPPLPLAPGERALKVMSFNTWLSNRDWHAVADEITRQDPDVVFLAEFGPEKEPLLEFLSGRYPYSVDCREVIYCHLGIISKYPFSKKEARTRWRGPPYIWVRFGPALGGLTLFGIHTTKPPHVRSQLKQLRTMAKVIGHVSGRRLAIGDFNATPTSEMLKVFAAQSGLRRLTWIPSWPARFGPFPQIAIDHMFASPGVRAITRQVIGDNAGSDHYPIIETVAVKVGQGG